ncbi:MAG: phosphoesterase [Pyrinomonadaceae bacterium]
MNENSPIIEEAAELAADSGVSRRKFFGHLGKSAIGAAAVTALGGAPFAGGIGSAVRASKGNDHGNSPSRQRMNDCFDYRRDMVSGEKIDVGIQRDNGDAARFTDFSGNYSKALLHNSLGVPNAAAYLSLKHALTTGERTDFANIIVGTPGGNGNSRLNGPQVALAFDLEGVDSHATVIPAAPSVASAQTAAEAVEHYWGALLVDVPFREYGSNPLAQSAIADLNNMSFFRSSANNQAAYPVTAQNLFRGFFYSGDGNAKGPYVSQFMVQPTYLGTQEITQRHLTFLPENAGGRSYMTNVGEYQIVANGGDSGLPIGFDPTARYLRAGRDLASYTRLDVLYQGYFTAFLVLAGLGAQPNPGNPYIGSRTEKAFCTLGVPDAAGTIAEMATRALKASWFHKWIKDNRLRPEEYGALVQARMGGGVPMPQAAAQLHSDVLNSDGVARTFSKYGTYLVPQAFPEGSPTHPCYPTGHGTVGGACITALKFFFNGEQKMAPMLAASGRNLLEPNAAGTALEVYNGADAAGIDINGELNKLAYNITFAHGVHAGIHFRSSSYWSILLGEQVALSILRDRARSYNEPFTISIKKFDGTTATISNQ